MTHTSFPTGNPARIVFCVGFFLLVSIAIFNGQEKKDSEASGSNFKIQVGVEEVRLDAVVLDRKGHQITDLTADNFEIYQDRRQQKVLSSNYIVDRIQPQNQLSFSSKDSMPPPFPSSLLTRETVRRVIVFVIDDFGMAFEEISRSRMALQKFVEKQMQPGDLVAIVPTHGSGALHMFSSDKRDLLARIRNLPWEIPIFYTNYIPVRNGYGRFVHYRIPSFAKIFSTIQYAFLALQNLPGRKEILILSSQPGTSGSADNPRWVERINRLADSALRAGIVVNSLNIIGLGASITLDDTLDRFLSPYNLPPWENDLLKPLVKKTGGMYLENNSFFFDGIGSVKDAINGYYLISYVPPPDTFKQGENVYHRVVIKVKRHGAEIHTRDGFFGVTQVKTPSPGDRNPIFEAVFSPLQYEDVKVSLSSGFVKDDKEGYLLRSWAYVNAADLSFTDNGREHSASLETACVTSDIEGNVLDENNKRYDQINTQRYVVYIKDENLSWVREHGLRFNLVLPVKKPGSYYVQLAVKEEATGKIGSAYQFIQIPEIKKDRLALSNMFFINSGEDASWIQSGTAGNEHSNLLNPNAWHDPGRSPALKRFAPGESFDYMAIIYNAGNDKGLGPDLECQSFLYRNGELLYKNNPETVNLEGVTDFSKIPIMKRLTLDTKTPPGDYVLRLQVKDKKAVQIKFSYVTQQIDFQVAEKPAAD